jgi:hypothetical protein
LSRAARPVGRISQGVPNIFDCGANPALFDARQDLAVRDWARRSDDVADEVARAANLRLDAITALFATFGASPTQAVVRVRTLFFRQIGYYALELRERSAERMALLAHYVIVFMDEVQLPGDIRDFIR